MDQEPGDAQTPDGLAAQAGVAGEQASVRFRFSAQSIEDTLGDKATPVTGAIDAANAEAAQHRLASMRLRVLSLEPQAPEAGRGAALRGGAFLAFNQQLAFMTEAGLPMERGLRLIAADTQRGALRTTIERVADELKAGKGLAEAFASHRGAFPPLYAAVLDAGLRTGNLPGVLMGLGRHLELVHRLKAAVWRSIAYPLVVFFGVLAMLGVLGAVMAPQFRELFVDFDTDLPAMTVLVLALAEWMPLIAGALVLLGVAAFLGAALLRARGADQLLADRLLWIPLVGQAVRRNMLSRWCDALRLGIDAGLDLPGALRIASDMMRSGPITRDTDKMIDAMTRGQAIRGSVRLSLIPEAVPAAIELAANADDLPGMIQDLTGMYQQQAEARVSVLHMLLGPAMLVVVAALISIVIWALFLPMVQLMESLM